MKVIFLDRDGVINEYPGDADYVKRWEEFRFLPSAKDALKRLNQAGFLLHVISNQAGINKGIYTQENLDRITSNMVRELAEHGVEVSGVHYCIHKEEENCSCRKPKTGLVEKVLAGLESRGTPIQLKESYFIGDTLRDIETGKKAGLKTILVFSGKEKPQAQALWPFQPDFTARDLSEAAALILKMKILITYASCGAGHFKAAQAVYNHLKEHRPDIKLECVDILEHVPAAFRNFYKGSYSFLVRHALVLWRVLFWLTDFKPTAAFIRPIGFAIDLFNARGFVKFLIEQQFDCIFSTHFFPAEAAGYLKKSGKIFSRLVTLITDYGVHGYWVASGIDHYLVATEATREQLINKRVPASKITVSGIPVDRAFMRRHDADKAGFTVLIGAGSFGIGPIEKLVDLLHKEVSLLVVCAGNLRLLEGLRRKNYPGVQVFGFVDHMPELMARSSLIVTKAGGMTIAEILSTELVPVFMMAIPGQETENIRVLLRYGIGSYSTDPRKVRDRVLAFKQYPEKLELIRENIRKIKPNSALKEICRVVCENSSGRAC